MKKFVAILLVFSVVLSTQVCAESSLSDAELLEKSKIYHEAIEWFEARHSTDTHGDFYFDADGDLILNIIPEKFSKSMADDLEECNQALTKNSLTSNGIRTKEVKYTLDELHTFYNNAIAYYENEGFYSVVLDTVNNQIKVSLPTDRVRPQSISANSIIPFDAIEITFDSSSKFSATEPGSLQAITENIVPTATSVTVRPGTTGACNGAGSTMSWGVKYQGKYCFLFVGHGTSLGNSVFYNGYNIGKTIFRKVGGKLDCALVERSDSYKTISNVLPNGGTLSYASPERNYKANDTIWMYGAVSARRTGTIVSCAAAITTGDGYSYKDVILASYRSAQGDSGAPVYYGSTAGNTPLGIHIATNATDNTALISPLYDILERTGGVLYDF